MDNAARPYYSKRMVFADVRRSNVLLLKTRIKTKSNVVMGLRSR